MVWKFLLLVSFLGVTDKAWSFRNRKRDLHDKETVIYALPDNSCAYTCSCPSTGTADGCANCQECPRLLGEPCSVERPCDRQKGFICKYKHGDKEGICRESTSVPCIVYNKTYEHGETFSLDCRTQCACQNGTYGCSSLCPQEHIAPQGSCQHPRLVEIPTQCCKEWICDSQTAEHPPSCQPTFSRWTLCSSDCGSGLSTRQSNLNARCQPNTETRLCQTRRCTTSEELNHHQIHHHLRRGHECKATHRLSSSVFLRLGPCRSRKRFRPKYCGVCPLPNVSCHPTLSTTVKVEFLCEGADSLENLNDLLPEYLEPGSDLWYDPNPDEDHLPSNSRSMTILVQWLLKCRCVMEKSNSGEVILHRVHRTTAP